MGIGWIKFLLHKVPWHLMFFSMFQLLTKLTGLCQFSIGKTREDLENFINEGVYKVERLKEEGWITNILYDDEVQILLLFAYNLGLDVLWERINICYGNNLIEKVRKYLVCEMRFLFSGIV